MTLVMTVDSQYRCSYARTNYFLHSFVFTKCMQTPSLPMHNLAVIYKIFQTVFTSSLHIHFAFTLLHCTLQYLPFKCFLAVFYLPLHLAQQFFELRQHCFQGFYSAFQFLDFRLVLFSIARGTEKRGMVFKENLILFNAQERWHNRRCNRC